MASDSGISTLTRWKQVLFGVSALAATISIYYLTVTRQEEDESNGRGLRRSNAVRRRSPHRLRHSRGTVAGERTSEATAQIVGGSANIASNVNQYSDDDSEVDLSAATGTEGGQSLLNLLYYIAEEQAHKEGFVHRGVTCNSCSSLPIKGIRYRCANCPDYDLCEQCENAGVHDRTHLFYKIRIPAPFLGSNPRNQQPVWYPGKPYAVHRTIPKDLRNQLVALTGFDRPRIDALWEQFKSLAAVDWPEDPSGLRIAIDRKVWSKYCMPTMLREHEVPSALIFDQSFTFYDDNEDGLVGFEEFLGGLAAKQGKDPQEKLRRIFRAHDLDRDGYVCREDFIKLFTSNYTFMRELSRDLFHIMYEEVLDDRALRDSLKGNQPVSSCFTGTFPPGEASRTGEGKTMNSTGDYEVTDGGDFMRRSDHSFMHDLDSPAPPSSGAMANIFDELGQPFEDWPPEYVIPDDARAALGKIVSLNSITAFSDQRLVLDAANQRLEQQRQEENPQTSTHEDNERSAGTSSDASVLATIAVSEQSGSVDPQLSETESEADDISVVSLSDQRGAGTFFPDFLYKATREGFQELLDPMFKQLEDLLVLYENSANERERLEDSIQAYRSKQKNETLAYIWLNRHLRYWRRGSTKSADWYGVRLGEDIAGNLTREIDPASDEWVSLMVDKILMQYVSEEELNAELDRLASERLDPSGTVIHKLRTIWSETQGREVPDPKQLDEHIEKLNDQLLSTASLSNRDSPHDNPEGNVVHIDEDAIQTLLDGDLNLEAQEHATNIDNGSDDSSPTTDNQGLASSNMQVDEIEGILTIQEAIRSLNDNFNDAGLGSPAPSERELQARWLDLQSGTDIPDSVDQLMEDFDLMEAEPVIDPTLPQNRPDSANATDAGNILDAISRHETASDRSKKFIRWSLVNVPGSLESMEQKDPFEDQESRHFEIKLKYLTILQLFVDQCEKRGGVGRLDREEFAEVMTGSKGRRLETIGKWLDLAAF